MGIVKTADVIGWDYKGVIFCCNCEEDDGEAKPLTEDDFSDDVCVYCDKCGDRIY